jgi:hypothetical protein
LATLGQVLIEELAGSRDGVVTRAETLRGGLTLRQIQHRVRAGLWAELHPGIYLVGRHEVDERVSVRAAAA